jgi:hypothetical protein
VKQQKMASHAKPVTGHWVPITRTQLRMGFVRDAALARKYAMAHPEHMEYALRVAALRDFAAECLRHPRTKVQP